MLLTSLNSIVQMISALLIFILVLALTYFTTKFTAGFQKEKLRSPNVEVVDTFRLSTNKLIQIIRTGNHYYSIAVCKDSVTVLGELTPEEVTIQETGLVKTLSFQEILDKAKHMKLKK